MQDTIEWIQTHTDAVLSPAVRLSEHATLKIGGKAAIVSHSHIPRLAELIAYLHESKQEYYVIGDTSNILFSDEDLAFPLVTTSALQQWRIEDTILYTEAGVPISLLARETAKRGLKGLENFYAMPGSIGGAVYMNARCFGREIADVLLDVQYIDAKGALKQYTATELDFHYKHSPFQAMPGLCIAACTIQLEKQNAQELLTFAEQCHSYRKTRGHFDYPCAGSIFKNNRNFGKPTGALLDSLGMKELSVGGACVSSKNANIIQNRNRARSRDVTELIRMLEEITVQQTGFSLEREVQIVGTQR